MNTAMNMTTFPKNIKDILKLSPVLKGRLKIYKYRISLTEPIFQKYLGYEMPQHRNGKKIISVINISKKIDDLFNRVIMPLYKIKPKKNYRGESEWIISEVDKVIEKLNRFNPDKDDFEENISVHLFWILSPLKAFFNKDIDKLREIIEKREKTDRVLPPILIEIFENRILSATKPDGLRSDEEKERERLGKNIKDILNWLERNQRMTKLFETNKKNLINDLNRLKIKLPNFKSEYDKQFREFHKQVRKRNKLREKPKRQRGRPPLRLNVLIFHLSNSFTFVRYNKKGKAVGWARRDWELITLVLLYIHFNLFKIREVRDFLKRHHKKSQKETFKQLRDMMKKEYNNFRRSGKGKFGRNFRPFQKAAWLNLWQCLEPWLDYPIK